MQKDKLSFKTLALLIMVVFLIGGVFIGCGKKEEEKPKEAAEVKDKAVVLDVPMAYPSALPGLGTTIIWMADRIELLSDKSLKIKIYEPGKLVPPFEMLDAVSAGKVNACYGVSGYWQGKFPAASFFTAVPFGPEATEYLGWIYYGNGMKIWQEKYVPGGMNVKALHCGGLPPETYGL